jgi:hypothetical protein
MSRPGGAAITMHWCNGVLPTRPNRTVPPFPSNVVVTVCCADAVPDGMAKAVGASAKVAAANPVNADRARVVVFMSGS